MKKSRWMLNLFIVWLLTGIWHGANWTFVLWGLIYFVVLLMEKQTGLAGKIGPLAYIYTMVIVIFAWVFFRSENVAAGCRYIGYMIGVGTANFADGVFIENVQATYIVLIFSLIGVTPLISKLLVSLRRRNLVVFEWAWLLIVFTISILEIVSASYNPFIYFNF